MSFTQRYSDTIVVALDRRSNPLAKSNARRVPDEYTCGAESTLCTSTVLLGGTCAEALLVSGTPLAQREADCRKVFGATFGRSRSRARANVYDAVHWSVA